MIFHIALKKKDIITIGIGDGGNEVGMGKVYDDVLKYVPFGDVIASTISCDYLISCGVSNWGGFAVAVGLSVLSNCPVFDRYKCHGLENVNLLSFEELVYSTDKVSIKGLHVNFFLIQTLKVLFNKNVKCNLRLLETFTCMTIAINNALGTVLACTMIGTCKLCASLWEAITRIKPTSLHYIY